MWRDEIVTERRIQRSLRLEEEKRFPTSRTCASPPQEEEKEEEEKVNQLWFVQWLLLYHQPFISPSSYLFPPWWQAGRVEENPRASLFFCYCSRRSRPHRLCGKIRRIEEKERERWPPPPPGNGAVEAGHTDTKKNNLMRITTGIKSSSYFSITHRIFKSI